MNESGDIFNDFGKFFPYRLNENARISMSASTLKLGVTIFSNNSVVSVEVVSYDVNTQAKDCSYQMSIDPAISTADILITSQLTLTGYPLS